MNRSPLPTDKPTMLPRRPEQSLTCLAPGVSGAALLPVLLVVQRTESVLQANKGNVQVKSAIISSCTTNFSFRFTHVTGYLSDRRSVANIDSEKRALAKDLKRAGATPPFRRSSAQKVFEVAPARFGSQAAPADNEKVQSLMAHLATLVA